MEPFILTLPLKPKKKTIHQHEGEELLFVLEGTMKFLLGNREYISKRGLYLFRFRDPPFR